MTPAQVQTVSVPRRLVEELASYLTSATGSEEVYEVSGNQGQWTRSMIEQLHAQLRVYPGAVALLDEAAEHPDEDVTYSAVVARAGMNAQQVRNELAAMTKLTHRLFGRRTWPLTTRQASSEMHYRMPRTTAAWWRSASS